MPENVLQEIADNADIIVAGYAFTKSSTGLIRVLNLNNPQEACVLQQDGTMVETTMDDLNILKVQSYYLKNKEFLEENYA